MAMHDFIAATGTDRRFYLDGGHLNVVYDEHKGFIIALKNESPGSCTAFSVLNPNGVLLLQEGQRGVYFGLSNCCAYPTYYTA